MYTASDVTVYVPFYNAHETIGACLESLGAQTVRPARVLLIDDGSQEPPDGHNVEVICHRKNRGLAAGRNTALAVCQTPLLGSLDADVVAEPDWLEHLLAAMNANDVVGVAGCMTEHFQTTLGDRWRAVHMAQHWGDRPVHNPRFLYGANTLYDVGAVREVGGYDPSLRTNDEDRTLCEALYADGKDLLYVPTARCRHLRQDTCHTILRGFWQWYRPRGLKRGDFDSADALIRRLDRVGFGIFRYRFDMDRTAGRNDLLGLDAAIPWVFSVMDLDLFSRRRGVAPPRFPTDPLMAPLPGRVTDVLLALAPPAADAAPTDWFDDYTDEFQRCLADSGWLADCLGRPEIWHRLRLESCPCGS